jgi:hypothetical protein
MHLIAHTSTEVHRYSSWEVSWGDKRLCGCELQVLKDPTYMDEVKRCTPMKRVGEPDEVAGE